jgi:choline transport protein
MVWSVFINGAMGFVWVITLLYVCPDLNAVLTEDNGAAIIVILSAAFKSQGATIFVELLLIYIGTVASVGLTASASRMMWAFARDKGFPFQQFLTHISPKWQVPVNAIVIIVIIQMLIGTINFGNTTAFQAIVSLATIAILFTYLVPPALMLLYARRNMKIEYGPFKLGRFGIFLNIISCGFTLLFFVLLNFPTVQAPYYSFLIYRLILPHPQI